jgi:hypothetical protein
MRWIWRAVPWLPSPCKPAGDVHHEVHHYELSGTFQGPVVTGRTAKAQITNDLASILPILDELLRQRSEIVLSKDEGDRLAEAAQAV